MNNEVGNFRRTELERYGAALRKEAAGDSGGEEETLKAPEEATQLQRELQTAAHREVL